jgi:hypothetical protein
MTALRIGLNFWQTVSLWTASWLSFLIPLCAGTKAKEARYLLQAHVGTQRGSPSAWLPGSEAAIY